MPFGFSLLGGWKPSAELVLEHLKAPRYRPLRLERFSRGVDNAHIDVLLHEGLRANAAALIDTLIREDIQRSFWGQPVKAPNLEVEQAFGKIHVELSRAVVAEARALASIERVQLYQLALWRLFLSLVDAAIQNLRRELDEARAQPARQISGQSLELHERAVILARNQTTIRYRALANLNRMVMRLEAGPLRKVRKTVLGVSWPLPEGALANPLLQIGGIGRVEDFHQHYPVALHDIGIAAGVNRALLRELSRWLPEVVVAPRFDRDAGPRDRHDQGGLVGYVDVENVLQQLAGDGELAIESGWWLDDPDNLVALLGGLDSAWPDPGPWKISRFARFQRALLGRIERGLEREGILDKVLAANDLAELSRPQIASDAVPAVYAYLCGDIGRRELGRRVEALASAPDRTALLRRLDGARRTRRRDHAYRIRGLIRMLQGFARYRRDLKLAWWTFRGMDSLRNLVEGRELELSVANGLLQDFSGKQDLTRQNKVVGHVIIKADVRGSTRITAQMLERGLNPASYFSRNLYDPINTLLDEFYAEKVFVEGDAVIVAIMEYQGWVQRRPAVALACGLARKILDVVDAKNAESRRLELPLLELGLGIAYSDQPPAYLYDEGHKITISDAINKADRLSSCNAALRALKPRGAAGERGVEVVTPVQSGDDSLVRYNVNGIELDAPAFYQLKSELATKALDIPSGPTLRGGRFHIGRYADARGNAHWLIVREASALLWMGNELISLESPGQPFYEVLTDRETVTRILTHMKISMGQERTRSESA